MKVGTSFRMKIASDIPLDLVGAIRFCFEQKQSGTRLFFEYPSDRVTRIEDTDSMFIDWTQEETFMFRKNTYAVMDTYVTMKDSPFNPPTKTEAFIFRDTIFEQRDFEEGGSND